MTTPREKDYQESYRLAREAFRAMDPEEVGRNSGASCLVEPEGRRTLRLPFLNRDCLVQHPGGEVAYADGEEVPLWGRILILHYLMKASGMPLKGRFLTFKEIPDGAFYLPAFDRRTKKPLVEVFGPKPERLLDAAAPFKGKRGDLGDVSVTILALPRVPITLVLWKGDEEFPPDGNVLFDETVTQYLPTEDITVLSQMLIIHLIRAFKS